MKITTAKFEKTSHNCNKNKQRTPEVKKGHVTKVTLLWGVIYHPMAGTLYSAC